MIRATIAGGGVLPHIHKVSDWEENRFEEQKRELMGKLFVPLGSCCQGSETNQEDRWSRCLIGWRRAFDLGVWGFHPWLICYSIRAG